MVKKYIESSNVQIAMFDFIVTLSLTAIQGEAFLYMSKNDNETWQ
jgi:hypothetical protein